MTYTIISSCSDYMKNHGMGDIMSGLKKGLIIQIESYKHNGSIHRVWKKNTILNASDSFIIGVNDETEVVEHDGMTWITEEPGVFYFSNQWWFNIIGLLRPNGIHYYCNLSSPFVYNQQSIKYIDYDLDVKVYPDLTYHILDKAEFHMNKKRMNYPRDLDYILHEQLDHLLHMIRNRHEPFSSDTINYWYEQYLTVQSQLDQ